MAKENTKSTKKITEDTRVNVYNNIGNKVVFRDATQNKVVINKAGQFKSLYVRDLRSIMSDAEALLTEGILYIKNKDVREFLDINEFYEDGRVFDQNNIDKILNDDFDKVKDTIQKASDTLKKEIAFKAKDKRKELTMGTVEIIENETGIDLEEIE